MARLLTPNKVTLLRVALGGAAVGLYAVDARENAAAMGCAALALTIGAIALDGVDGYLARRFHLATPLGAQIDILGDRVIENIFFLYFAVCGQVPLWVPILFFVRGTLADFLRGISAARAPRVKEDAESFHWNWMLRSRAGRLLVASRLSRGAYAAMKCLCFVALGLEWTLLHSRVPLSSHSAGMIHTAVNGLVLLTAAFCVVRAVPVFWEGWRDFAAMARPAIGVTRGAQKLPARARSVLAVR